MKNLEKNTTNILDIVKDIYLPGISIEEKILRAKHINRMSYKLCDILDLKVTSVFINTILIPGNIGLSVLSMSKVFKYLAENYKPGKNRDFPIMNDFEKAKRKCISDDSVFLATSNVRVPNTNHNKVLMSKYFRKLYSVPKRS